MYSLQTIYGKFGEEFVMFVDTKIFEPVFSINFLILPRNNDSNGGILVIVAATRVIFLLITPIRRFMWQINFLIHSEIQPLTTTD